MVNTGASGVNGATQATGDIPPVDCQELDSRNKKERAALGSDESKSIQSAFGEGGATTVAHASLNGGSPTGAASRLLPLRYKHLAEGLWANTTTAQRRKMRKTGRSNVCPGAPFKYGKACRPHQSHCESKILETLFSGSPKPSGNLLVNINWQSQDNPNSKLPCRACKKLLCHAQESCNLNIELCQKDPKKPAQALQC